ncbi:MAG: TonB-dependent receptor [Bacteroidales bacterium]|nr:TonB-dependent receptor [Bacteroidales bacterium]
MLFSILISAGLLLADRPAEPAEQPSDTLHAVTVTADKGVVISRTDTLHITNTFDITGELHQVPGLQLGDYGGFAGLKTVSLRGMGSPHTAVYVDGVRVGNVQSGQGDMGMLDIENFSSAVVDYAQNSISFNTARPTFGQNRVAGKATFKAGSFGTYLPAARIDLKLSERLALSVNAAGVISKGDFPIADGATRANNDIRQVRGGVNLFGSMKDGDYHVKAFYNAAERGTPGSISWPSEDRQKDMNAYLQGVMKKSFSPLYTLRLSAKAGYDDIYYTSSWGDSQYGQTELQLNSSHVFSIKRWWKVSLAADIQWDKLASTNYSASRTTAISAVSTSFNLSRLSLNAAAEYSGYFDKGEDSRHAISPSVDFRVRAIDGLDIVGFARKAYRVPMFNELYYVGYGNPDLKPEDAWLTDLGVDFHRQVSRTWNLKAKVDGFYNILSNKITSAPTAEDPNIWLPYNIGKVRAIGLDLVTGADFTYGDWKGEMDLRYSYQSAVDRTPDSYSYGQQIPYIAKHTVTASVKASWKGYELNPRWVLKSGRNDATGNLADWNTLDVTISKTFRLRGPLSLGINIAAKNLLDCRYELVSGYPMPGRSFIGGVEMKF